MANKTQAEVHRIRTVELKPTSWKSLTLENMKHVPIIAKNLISGSVVQDGLVDGHQC